MNKIKDRQQITEELETNFTDFPTNVHSGTYGNAI